MKFVQQKNKFRMWLSIVVALLLIFAYFNGSDPAQTSEPQPESTQSVQEQTISRESLWNEANKYRVDPLPLDPVLNESAEKRCDQIVASGELSHDGFQDTVDELNRHAGENIANGYTSSAELLAAWSTSPTHEKNLKNPAWKHVGYGICVHVKLGVIVVQHFSE